MFGEFLTAGADPELVLIMKELVASSEDLLAAAQACAEAGIKANEVRNLDDKWDEIANRDQVLKGCAEKGDLSDPDYRQFLKDETLETARLNRELASELRSLVELKQ